MSFKMKISIKRKTIYHIWLLECPFDFPDGTTQDFPDYDQAYNAICDLVHHYDKEPFAVVGCVDAHYADGNEDTIDYIENIR